MQALIVVENPKHWPVAFEGAEVVAARQYLTDRRFHELRRAAVFNVCRSYAYQTVGYYVSLLAAARGHRTLPSVGTLQDLNLASIIRLAGEDLDAHIQRDLARLKSNEFELSIYFGRNVARRYDRLSRALFNLFPAPLLRARFTRDPGNGKGSGRWRLKSIRPIPASEVPDEHRDFVVEKARDYFRRPSRTTAQRAFRYDLAILWRADDPFAPSDERAIRRFIKAAEAAEIGCAIIGPQDAGRIAEFDALWIRETTQVDHHTYRLARRASAEGMVVIDDPLSIVRCTNKVYQAEVFARHRIDCPRTLVVGPGGEDEIARDIGFPCVVKQPDSSFSRGVTRVASPDELSPALASLFKDTELVVVQEWLPTEHDWRIGVLDGSPLFVSRYFMARGHWQIAVHGEGRKTRYGRVETVPVSEAPEGVVDLAVRAARLFGDGLYGVDLKVVDGRPLVIEVNDNPNLEAGEEDAHDRGRIYRELAQYFRQRLDQRGDRPGRSGA